MKNSWKSVANLKRNPDSAPHFFSEIKSSMGDFKIKMWVRIPTMFDFGAHFRWTYDYYWVLLITIYRNSWLISGFWDRKHLVNVTEVSGKSLELRNDRVRKLHPLLHCFAEFQNERAASLMQRAKKLHLEFRLMLLKYALDPTSKVDKTTIRKFL